MDHIMNLGKVAIAGGACLFAVYLTNEEGATLMSEIKETIRVYRALKAMSTRPNPEPVSGLLKKIEQLERINQRMVESDRAATIVTTNGSWGKHGIIIVVVVVGYGYFWWKGWKLDDMMSATKRSLSDAKTAVFKQLENVFSLDSGWKLDDVMFATKCSLSDVKTAVSKQLEYVFSDLGWKLADMMYATQCSLSDAKTVVSKLLENVFSSDPVSSQVHEMSRVRQSRDLLMKSVHNLHEAVCLYSTANFNCRSKEMEPVQLKVFVDKQKNQVMFAEAEQDFVDILFSFLTLPLGTIAKLSTKHPDSKEIKLGSLTSLYQSVKNIEAVYFRNDHCKDALVNPRNSSSAIYRKLKVNLNDCVNDSSQGDAELVKNKGTFIVTDELFVKPFLLDESIQLLKTLGVEDVDLLDKRTVYFGLEEFSDLLKWSLLTNNPLTSLVIGGSKLHSFSSNIITPKMGSLVQPKTIKLLVQKSTMKVLCAQVDNFFIELLFSFLTIPLGLVKRLTVNNTFSVAVSVNNLYSCILSLGCEKYLKSEDIKTMLLCPKVDANYLRVTDFLPIYESSVVRGSFLKDQGLFIVSDDLKISHSPSISSNITDYLIGICVSDTEVKEMSIGEAEALYILNASLTSTSVLTDCLNAFGKNPKI